MTDKILQRIPNSLIGNSARLEATQTYNDLFYFKQSYSQPLSICWIQKRWLLLINAPSMPNFPIICSTLKLDLHPSLSGKLRGIYMQGTWQENWQAPLAKLAYPFVFGFGWRRDWLFVNRGFKGINPLLKSTGPQFQVRGLPLIWCEAETTLRKIFPKSRSPTSCLPIRSILAKRSKAANDPSVASQRKSGEVWPFLLPTTKLALDLLTIELSMPMLELFRLLEMVSRWRSGYIVTGTAWGGTLWLSWQRPRN